MLTYLSVFRIKFIPYLSQCSFFVAFKLYFCLRGIFLLIWIRLCRLTPFPGFGSLSFLYLLTVFSICPFSAFFGYSPTAFSNTAVLKALFYVFGGLNCLLPSAWYSRYFILFMFLLLLLMTHTFRLFPAWYLFHY